MPLQVPGYGYVGPIPKSTPNPYWESPAAPRRKKLRSKRAVLPEGDGLRVVMQRIAGHTKRGILVRPFVFQVPPMESFVRAYGHGFTDYETLRHGQHSRRGTPQLITVTFATMFVDYGAPFTLYDQETVNFTGPSWGRRGSGTFARDRGDDPQEMTEELIDVSESGTPFQLIVGQKKLWARNDIDMAATLRTLQVEERAGEIDARYVDVSFTQHRSPTITKGGDDRLPVTLSLASLPPGRRTMRELAKFYYHSASHWSPLVAANPYLRKVAPSTDLRARFAKDKTHRTIRIPKVAKS